MSDSVRPQRQQPTRLPHPWDSPGKNIGVGCHFLLQCIKVKMKWLSRVRLLVTPWTAAYQAPPSTGFSRQEYWSGLPLPSPINVNTWIFILWLRLCQPWKLFFSWLLCHFDIFPSLWIVLNTFFLSGTKASSWIIFYISLLSLTISNFSQQSWLLLLENDIWNRDLGATFIYWLNGHEFGWTPGVGDGQGGLVCCDSWGRRVGHDWATQLNWTEILTI